MAYEQAGGPSTPGRGYPSFGRPNESFQQPQQRTPSGSGTLLSSSTTFGHDFTLHRSSSMKSLNASTQSPHAGFGFGGMRETSTPKSVRWEDAQSSLTPHHANTTFQAPASSSSSSFGFSYQQPMGSQQPQQQPNPMHQMQPYMSARSPQQLPQATPQMSSSLSASNPTHSNSSSSSTALQQSQSAFFRSVGQATALVKPSSSPKSTQPTTIKPPTLDEGHRDVVIASRPAILARLKWNVLALLICWLAPHTSLVSRIYWIMLDAAYGLFGGVADVHLATTLSWFRKASTLLLLVNIVEATIRLNTNSLASDGGAVAIQTKRKPSLANPPGRVPSSQSSPAPSPLGKRNIPRHYAQGSPLRESIFRASASAQGLGEGRRLPSQSPSFEMGRKSSASATPLAAFLARKQERLTSGGGDVGDLSWDGGDADLSTDTIEVDRALRAFSAGYERELSQSRSSMGAEARKDGIAA